MIHYGTGDVPHTANRYVLPKNGWRLKMIEEPLQRSFIGHKIK
jgi:hypothetical protein